MESSHTLYKSIFLNFCNHANKIVKYNFIDTKKAYITIFVCLLYFKRSTLLILYQISKKKPNFEKIKHLYKNGFSNIENIPIKSIHNNYSFHSKIFKINNYQTYSKNNVVIDVNINPFRKKHLSNYIIKAKLAGINEISDEGVKLLDILIDSNKNFKYCKVKLNNLSKDNNINVLNIWLFVKPTIFSGYININYLLIKNGYCKVKSLNNCIINDIKIYKYVIDMIEAEKYAKACKLGIHNKLSKDNIDNTNYVNSIKYRREYPKLVSYLNNLFFKNKTAKIIYKHYKKI